MNSEKFTSNPDLAEGSFEKILSTGRVPSSFKEPFHWHFCYQGSKGTNSRTSSPQNIGRWFGRLEAWLFPAKSRRKTHFFSKTSLYLTASEKSNRETCSPRGGTIKDLGPNVKSLERSIKVDVTGRTLIPGLIDSHTHPYCPLRARSWEQKLFG